jgi:hypothetical protein
MKKSPWISAGILMLLAGLPQGKAHAQFPFTDIITEGIIAVITAADLRVQQLQNETIWLQNAHKVLENELTRVKLGEIVEWTEKQRDLYAVYYEELREVKSTVSYYPRIRDISSRSAQLLEEYRKGWNLVRQDQNFTQAELDYMQRVYSGILEESARNLDQIQLVIQSFQTRMNDAGRLKILEDAAARIEQNYADVRQFNRQNLFLSLRRASSGNQILQIQRLYGISADQ